MRQQNESELWKLILSKRIFKLFEKCSKNIAWKDEEWEKNEISDYFKSFIYVVAVSAGTDHRADEAWRSSDQYAFCWA